MYIIGIDPGISGAICFFEDGKIIDVIEMPTMSEGKKNKKQVNGNQLFNEIKSRLNYSNKEFVSVVVEHVTAMPGQGVTSMFNFGQSYGVIKGICSAMQLPIHFVRPTKWKKYFNLIKTSKDASRSRAIEIFPKASEKLKEILVSNQLETSLFFPRIICEALRNTSLEQWYEAIDSANRLRELSEKKNSGFIYIAINNDVYRDGKGIDEEVKIGKTKNIEKRKDNYKTYSSDGWLFLDVWHVNNRHRAENFIHNALKKYKVDKGSGKEFFKLSSKEAISRVEDLIEECQKQNGYLYEETIPSGRGFK